MRVMSSNGKAIIITYPYQMYLVHFCPEMEDHAIINGKRILNRNYYQYDTGNKKWYHNEEKVVYCHWCGQKFDHNIVGDTTYSGFYKPIETNQTTNETTYLLRIWENDDKNSKDDWNLGYHFITDPQEILDRIKKFKKFNPKWYEWKPSIYTVKKIDVNIKAFSEHVKSFMDAGGLPIHKNLVNIWQEIVDELKGS